MSDRVKLQLYSNKLYDSSKLLKKIRILGFKLFINISKNIFIKKK